MFANGSVKNADSRQNHAINNQFEITFSVKSTIVPMPDNHVIRQQQLFLVKIDRIADCGANSVIDVIGIVRSVGDVAVVKSTKNETDYIKRDIALVDDSGCEIKVSLWGKDAELGRFNWSNHPVVCIQGALVKHFNGRSLSTTPNSVISVNLDCDEVNALRKYRARYADGMIPVLNSLTTFGTCGLYMCFTSSVLMITTR